jgi:hypothetical protein
MHLRHDGNFCENVVVTLSNRLIRVPDNSADLGNHQVHHHMAELFNGCQHPLDGWSPAWMNQGKSISLHLTPKLRAYFSCCTPIAGIHPKARQRAQFQINLKYISGGIDLSDTFFPYLIHEGFVRIT